MEGKITLREGKWKQTVFHKYSGEIHLSGWEEKDLPSDFNPENKLTTSVKKIKKSLAIFSKKNPWVERVIKGVLVFTREDFEMDISNCLVPYGNLMNLSDMYRNTPSIFEMTFEKQLEIVDILLSQHRGFEENDISSVQVAEEIYYQSLKYLNKLVDSYCNF